MDILLPPNNAPAYTLTEAEAAAVFGQLLIALLFVHAAGACHRDIKPENLMVGSDGAVRLIDFGFCKRLDPSGALCRELCGSTSCVLIASDCF